MNGPSSLPRCKDAAAARSWATARYRPDLYSGYGIMVVSRILSSTSETVDFVWPTTDPANRGRWMIIDVVGLYEYDEDKTKTAKTVGYLSQKRWKAEAERIGKGIYRIAKDRLATTLHALQIKPAKTPWHLVCDNTAPPKLSHYVRRSPYPMGQEITMDVLDKWIRLRIALLSQPSYEAEHAISVVDDSSFVVLSEVILRFGSDALFEWWRNAEQRLYEARVHSSFKTDSSERDGIDWFGWLLSVDIDAYSVSGQNVPDEHTDSYAFQRLPFHEIPWLLSSKPLLVNGFVYVTPELLKSIVLRRYRMMVISWMDTCRGLSVEDRRMVARLGGRGHRYPNPHLFELVKMAAAIEKIVQPSPQPVIGGGGDEMKRIMGSTKDEKILIDRLPPCVIEMIRLHRLHHSQTLGNELRFDLSNILRNLGLSSHHMKSLLKMSPARAQQLDKEIKGFWTPARNKYESPTCSHLIKIGCCPMIKERCVDPLSRQPVSTPVELTRARIQIEMDMST
jgi:hypothetical protein